LWWEKKKELFDAIILHKDHNIQKFFHIYPFVRRKFLWQLEFKNLAEQGQDYVILNEISFRILYSKYGGGPILPVERS
jgi:hypothetical protein